MLLTDPPTVPNGTTAVYVTYSGLAVHIAGAGNNSGWHVLNAQGSIDLMSIINVSQTIASANIQSGRFRRASFQHYFGDSHFSWHKLFGLSCLRRPHACRTNSWGNNDHQRSNFRCRDRPIANSTSLGRSIFTSICIYPGCPRIHDTCSVYPSNAVATSRSEWKR